MGEDAKLFIGQGVKIMVGDNPVGIAKEGMLTYQVEDDGATKDSGAWENPMHHTYEITGKAVATNVGDPIRELLNDMPSKVDVEIRREMGKMPRKMKKAYRTGSRYRRDTKWKRKAKAYERRFIYRLPNAEMVVTREQFGVLEATIKGSELQLCARKGTFPIPWYERRGYNVYDDNPEYSKGQTVAMNKYL